MYRRICTISLPILAAAGVAFAAAAPANAQDGPGVISGNLIQVPVNVPVNICGNTIDVISLLNPAFGNTCVNL